jgi:uncharacterized protein
MTTELPDGSSPCTKVCVLDDASGWCLGCGRTGDEIAGWLAMPVTERIAVKRALAARLERLKATPRVSEDRS